MKSSIVIRLSIMMFLQFFIWGAWYVSGPYFLDKIGFGPTDIGRMYGVGPIAGMISPLFVGIIADRYFATERILGVMHLLGAAALYASTLLMVRDYNPNMINMMFFVHMLCFFPTLSLINSLAMHNMTDSEKQFPLIRVFGTIGWIIAGFSIAGFGFRDNINQFYLAIGAQIALGFYCFTLPHTPPPQAGKKASPRELLGLDAFVLLKKKPYFIFMLSSFLICIPLAFYYQITERYIGQAGVTHPPFKMTWGQMSEAVFMVMIPFLFRRWGVKWMLVVGMGAWVIRYGLFANAATDSVHWMLLSGIVLHGICYDFFFVTGQIYTDKIAPEKIRGQAQGMLALFTIGLGMVIGSQVAGQVEKYYTPVDIKAQKKVLNEQIAVLNKETANLNTRIGVIEEYQKNNKEADTKKEMEEVKSDLRGVESEIENKKTAIFHLVDWESIWRIPAIFAAGVLVFFILFFKEDKEGCDIKNEPAAGKT